MRTVGRRDKGRGYQKHFNGKPGFTIVPQEIICGQDRAWIGVHKVGRPDLDLESEEGGTLPLTQRGGAID
jgi:hypothetical protein